MRALIVSLFIASVLAAPVFLFTSSSVLGETKDDQTDEKMKIQGLGFDQITQTPVVLLSDKKGERIIPIWIGLCEARSIEIGVSGMIPPRPLTYDMVAALIRTMKGDIKRIVITDLRDQVYYAQIEVSVNGKVSSIDARPSDAIALATRMNSPIYVTKSVLEKAALLDSDVEEREL